MIAESETAWLLHRSLNENVLAPVGWRLQRQTLSILLWCVWLPAGEWSVLVTVWLTKKFIHNFHTVYVFLLWSRCEFNVSFIVHFVWLDIPHLSYCLNSCRLHLLAAESDSVTHSLLHLTPGTKPKCLASSLLYIRNRSVHHASEIAANENSKYLNYV